MGGYYDEIEIEDMTWDEKAKVFHYPCPCGDRFEISKGQLANYEDIATCPSCSLIIRVIYDPLDYEDYEEEEDEDEASSAEESEPKEDAEEESKDSKAPAVAPVTSVLSDALSQLNISGKNEPSDAVEPAPVVKEPAIVEQAENKGGLWTKMVSGMMGSSAG